MKSDRTTDSKTARFFSYYVETCPYTQQRIAEECGYKRANVISMFKIGNSPVPINKIPCLSKVIGCDPKRFLHIALEEYYPSILETVEAIQGELLSDNEKALLAYLREHVEDRNLRLNTDRGRAAIEDFVAKIGPKAGRDEESNQVST